MPAVTEQRDFLWNDERSILIFKYPDILSCSIWLTPVAITDLVLALQTIQTLVIHVTFKESHVSSFSFEPSEAWQQFQQSGQGGLCASALQSWGEAPRGSWAPAEPQSCRAPLAPLSIGFWVI